MGNCVACLHGYRSSDKSWQALELDRSTNVMSVIDYEHHEIHAGKSFSVGYTRTTDATDAHRSGVYLLTPDSNVEVHLTIEFAASFAAFYSLCRGVTIDLNEGTNGVAIENRHHNSADTSAARDNAAAHTANKVTTFTEAQIAAANFTAGTIFRTAPLVVGGGPKPAGGSSRGVQEYILKRNTPYVFLLTNIGANANVHHILLDWYEHTPKGT